MIFKAGDVKIFLIHSDGTETEVTGLVDEEINSSKDEKLKERQSWRDSVEESGEVVFVVE